MNKPFYMYPRKNTKGKNIYYVRFKNRHGKVLTAISSGQTSKAKAEAWAFDQMNKKGIGANRRLTIKKLGQDFFNIDGQWVTARASRGFSVTERYCKNAQSQVNLHIIPFLGYIKLIAISRADIADFRTHLYSKGYSGSTINHILSTLKTMLDFAEERGLIDRSPQIDRVSTTDSLVRGILTPKEANLIFSDTNIWEDPRAYTASLLAAVTGMRAGEIAALQCNDVQGDYIEVCKTFDWTTRKVKNSTKTGKSRIVPLPMVIRPYLIELINTNPWEDKIFLFFSLKTSETPMDRNPMANGFYRALKHIGIDKAERKRRNITFHSWRHFFNSFLINQRVPIQKVQQLTGHSTIEMSEHYYHVDDMADVRKIQEKIIKLKP